jgi:flagellar hook-basal body complex protein FliE
MFSFQRKSKKDFMKVLRQMIKKRKTKQPKQTKQTKQKIKNKRSFLTKKRYR